MLLQLIGMRKPQPAGSSRTCDRRELQKRMNVGHVDDHTGAELGFDLILFHLVLFLLALGVGRRGRFRRFVRRLLLRLGALVTGVNLLVCWVGVASFASLTLSEKKRQRDTGVTELSEGYWFNDIRWNNQTLPLLYLINSTWIRPCLCFGHPRDFSQSLLNTYSHRRICVKLSKLSKTGHLQLLIHLTCSPRA